MCGIVGAVAHRDVAGILLEGLKRLEYRGYDSAGIAMLDDKQQMSRIRVVGKVAGLVEAYTKKPTPAGTGIAHTRWATHGKPSHNNAHPHSSRGRVAIVHNGIIENHQALHQELESAGYPFESTTDSEVIAHLLHRELDAGADLVAAMQAVRKRLHGVYALVAIDRENPGLIVGAQHGAPLTIGVGFEETYLASDIQALLPVTNRFAFLQEDDLVAIRCNEFHIIDGDGKEVQRAVEEVSLRADASERGAYRHFMHKEIHEQPSAVAATLEGRLADGVIMPNLFGPETEAIIQQTRAITVVACGTSYHAGLVAKYWIERVAGLACQVDIASEFRYRDGVTPDDGLFVVVSQSGETADTLAALKHAKQVGYAATLAICNVPESSIVRAADLVLLTRAGPEIGVASTKAFTTQLVALALFTIELARHHSPTQLWQEMTAELIRLPEALRAILRCEADIALLAEQFVDRQHALFLGRGVNFPIAMEGALKLKEISYIHAEAYAAGELKHGPLALVDEDMPVVAVAPNDRLHQKLLSNLAEVHARGGRLYLVADQQIADAEPKRSIILPEAGQLNLLAPIALTLPLQLLAYHVAVLKGTDVDQPRNLAKSVTVE